MTLTPEAKAKLKTKAISLGVSIAWMLLGGAGEMLSEHAPPPVQAQMPFCVEK